MSTVTIPSVHYIGINLTRSSGDKVPLGFLTPGGTDAAAKKRINTVNTWCGYQKQQKRWVNNDDLPALIKDHPNAKVDQQVTASTTAPYYKNSSYVVYDKMEGVDYKILNNIPNEPQIGFRITTAITRSGSWNGTSKWVRIEDPRGFELEISVDNLVKVLTMTTFIDGVIQEECVWGRYGASNILLPVNSEPYQDAVISTNRKEQKAIPLKKVKIGDVIELKGTQVPVRKGVYCGLYREVNIDAYQPTPKVMQRRVALTSPGTRYSPGKIHSMFHVDKRYVILSRDEKGNDVYYGIPSIKVHAVLGRADSDITEQPEINVRQYTSHTGAGMVPLALTTTIVNVDDIASSINFVDVTTDEVANRSIEHRYMRENLYFSKLPDMKGYMMLEEKSKWDTDRRADTFRANFINIFPETNQWQSSGKSSEQCGTIFQAIAEPTVYSVELRVIDYEWLRMTILLGDRTVCI